MLHISSHAEILQNSQTRRSLSFIAAGVKENSRLHFHSSDVADQCDMLQPMKIFLHQVYLYIAAIFMSKEYVAAYADVIPNIYKFLREKILEGKICNKDKFNQKTMAILLGKCFGINRRVDFIN
ncbi:uncharacterized protein LOC124349125 [Daphnia pulicaria]|uniref:uncharacterized protein LOC124349125 n=1 Tax=Daphnia pulicaria TaxID=35523 RepID=UPI001EEBE254|nr:uncharacterized protein LOC124349125 [Daphnia pulicaria]XP_046655596.1 uncharacterized protein LOC124349125 [Daphnia pulicaria]